MPAVRRRGHNKRTFVYEQHLVAVQRHRRTRRTLAAAAAAVVYLSCAHVGRRGRRAATTWLLGVSERRRRPPPPRRHHRPRRPSTADDTTSRSPTTTTPLDVDQELSSAGSASRHPLTSSSPCSMTSLRLARLVCSFSPRTIGNWNCSAAGSSSENCSGISTSHLLRAASL